MATKSNSPESVVRDIKRKTRRQFNAEEKIRIILEGLKGEDSIASISRKEAIHPTQYYKWSKEFLEAGKRRLNGDTVREASSPEVKDLRDENEALESAGVKILRKDYVMAKRKRIITLNIQNHNQDCVNIRVIAKFFHLVCFIGIILIL